MTVYYIVVFLIIVLGESAQYLSAHRPIVEKRYKNGIIQNKNQYSIFYFLIIALFIFVGGFRFRVGADYSSYARAVYTSNEVIDAFKDLSEPLFKFVVYYSRSIFDDGITTIFVFNLIIVLLSFYGFSKYDENKITLFSLLFMFMGVWTFSFNGIRQAVACAVIFVGSCIIEKEENSWFKHVIKLVVICFVAFLFHKSAFFMLPIILLSNRKMDIKQIILLIISAIAIPLMFDNAYEFMEVDLNSDDSLIYIEHEINPIRLPVALAPLLLLALIKDKNELFTNERFITNMTFFHAILNIATMNSSYMHRITQYTAYFVIVFIVRSIKRIDPKLRWPVTILVFSLYFGFFMYGIYTSEFLRQFQWYFGHFGHYV